MDVTIKSAGQKIWISPQQIKQANGKGLEIDTTGMVFRGELQGTFISRRTYFMTTIAGWAFFIAWGVTMIVDLILLVSW